MSVKEMNHRFISLTDIARSMGTNLCKALPAFHAYTGSDFTSAFVRIGKIRPLSLLENSPIFQNTFIKMASSSELEADTFRSIIPIHGCYVWASKYIT